MNIEPVEPIDPGTLKSQWLKEGQDKASLQLLKAEEDYIQARRRKVWKEREAPEGLTGLALSGGGIRSATFCLGVMQSLARHGLLEKFDYLSTASGGGYIGGAVTWLVSEEAKKTAENPADDLGLDADHFPFGPCQAGEEKPGGKNGSRQLQRNLLSYLRHHGDYLTPGAGEEGINIFSLVGAVFRGTFLNLLVWIPVIVVLLTMVMWLAPAGPIADTTLLSALCEKISCTQQITRPMAFEYLLWLGLLSTALALLLVVVYSILTRLRRGRGGAIREGWYLVRRFSEKMAGTGTPLLLFVFAVGLLPVAYDYVKSYGGVLAMLAGLASHLPSFLSALKGDGQEEPPWRNLLVSAGATLFLYGGLLSSYALANWLYPHPGWIIVLFAVAAVTGWFVNLNYISIHRFYRDRLMEAFMPDLRYAVDYSNGKKGEPRDKSVWERLIDFLPAKTSDGAYLHDLFNSDEPKGPYHLINSNVILVNSQVPKYHRRGGDSFILSPWYCGSSATGWKDTSRFMGGRMTLPTAVAISGAAVNPNIGSEGVDMFRNRLLSLSMSLLNLKLGYWAHHPTKPPAALFSIPNHFLPGAYSIGNLTGLNRLGFNERRPFIQISDGGHFDNLGLYELIRRRVKFIVICDGAQDQDFSFSDLRKLISMVHEDFGVVIEFDCAGPDYVLPKTPPEEGFPAGRKLARQGHLSARIHYPKKAAEESEEPGRLLYLKTTLLEDSDFLVKAYAARHPAFPDQSTTDQFFDKTQFNAYRRLGCQIADKMLRQCPLPPWLGTEDTGKTPQAPPTQTA